MSGFFGASGSDFDLTTFGNISAFLPRPGSTSPDYTGFNASLMGSFTSRGLATTSYLTSVRRVGFNTTTTANTARGLLSTGGGLVHIGSASGRGGFKFKGTIGIDTKVATAECFLGFAPAATWAGSDVVSNKTDIIGVGADSGDTNFQIIHNDGTGVATKVDLGASFPFSNDTDIQLELECAPNVSTISYTVTRLDTGASSSGTITTNIPTNSTFITPFIFGSNLGTAADFQFSTHGIVVYDKRGSA